MRGHAPYNLRFTHYYDNSLGGFPILICYLYLTGAIMRHFIKLTSIISVYMLFFTCTLQAELFESFEGLSNFHIKGTSGSTLICDGMPMPGWSKIQPPHYDTYGSNQGGGYGWSACYEGRTPMCGWMSGTHSVPPTEGAGNTSAYMTYTLGGSKYCDTILVTPKLEGHTSTSEISFWYKCSFTNFADKLYCLISTNEVVDSLDDFTIEAWHRDMPRGDMDGDFGDPWQQVTINVADHVPVGTPFHVGFREYYWNNWYDVRVIELDVIKVSDVHAKPIIELNDVYTEGPEVHVDYNIFGGTPTGEVYIVWGSSPNPVRYGDWNSQRVEQGASTCVLENFPADSKIYVRAQVDHEEGTYFSDEEFIVYAGDADGEGYLFESFEGMSNFRRKTTSSSTIICDGIPMAGWSKIQPPHYDTYGNNQGGGYGWEACYSGRTPMCGWMSGTHSVPPTDGAGDVSAYMTYTLGGSKYCDTILVTPLLENIKPDYQISFWYKSSFTNFADSLSCIVSTDPEADSLEDFTIEAWKRDMPRGDMDGDFGDPWQKVTLDIGDMVPEGSDIRVGFREYYYNNWYDVRVIEMDVISSESERPRSCLSFDGTDDYVELNVTNEPSAYTIEAWVCPQSSGARNILVRTPDDPLTGYSRQLRINSSGQFEHYLYDGAEKTVTGTTVITPGNWYHIAGTAANNGEIKLYVNGAEEGTAMSIGTISSHGTKVMAGCATGGGFGYFNGQMDEIRFWNKVLTGSEIRDHINTYTRGIEDNLEACYHLDSTKGQDLTDSHNTGENSYWFGAVTDSYAFRKQQPYYNGEDDSTFIPETTPNADYTLEAWVYPKKEGAQTIMVLSDGDTKYSYLRHIRITSDNKFQFYNYDGTVRSLTGIKNIQLNTWHHVAVTAQNGGQMKLYVNGSLEAEAAAGNTMWGSGLVGYYVGKIAANDTYGWFNGWIKDPKETSGIKTEIQLLNEVGEATAFVVPYDSWPTWVESSAPIGDSTSAVQWHPRGAWSAMPIGTPEAERGLTATATITSTDDYVIYGDDNAEGIITDDIPGGSNAMRVNRIWHIGLYGQESNTVNLTFNAYEASASDICQSEFAGEATRYQLLRRESTTGNFSIYVATASTATETNVTFNGISITEGYYTLGMAAAPAPEMLPASDITAHSFTANWNAGAQPYVTGYRLDVSSDNFESLLIDNMDVGDIASYGVSGLEAGTEYSYRVRSVFQGLTSTNSAIATVTTLTEGHIGLSATPLEFQGTYGTSATNTFDLTNSGETTYTSTHSVDYNAGASDWLTLTPATPIVPALDNQILTAVANAQALNPGTYTATVTFNSPTADNSPQTLPVSLSVTKATAQVNISNQAHTYDGSTKSVTVSTTPAGLSTDVTYNGSGTAPADAGSYAVTAVINDTCYEGSGNGTMTISKASQLITVFTPTDGSSFASTQIVVLAASTSTGLPVTFSIVSGEAELFNGNELRFTGGGSVQVQASQAGNNNYTPASLINTYSITDNTPIHYVAQNGQSAYPPYATWETAATNIQQAADIAIAGDTVIVSDGVYQTGTTSAPIGTGSQCRLIADKPITIESLNGLYVTEIRGGNEIRGAYIGNGATLSGFSISGGESSIDGDEWTDKCGGGVFINTTGTVENCRIENNSATSNGGGVYLYNGGRADCLTVVSNSAYYGGGISSVSGGTIRNSLLVDNQAVIEGGGTFAWWDGDVVNCTLSGNSASGSGDGCMFYQGGSLYNSIVIGNGDNEVFFKEYSPITANNFISGDPEFADKSASNYRLGYDSPCIGAGTNLWTDGAEDLDYAPRTDNGKVDIGCYQTPQSAGNALKLDNSQSFLIQNPTNFNLSRDFTLEAWVKTTSNGAIFTKTGTSGSWIHGGKQFGVINGRFYFGVYDVNTFTTGTVITDDNWHHLAVTFRASPREITLYVDGTAELSDNPGSWTGELDPAIFRIGSCNAEIDEMRFWTETRSAEEIRWAMFRSMNGSESNLLWYSRANQVSAEAIVDLTGNGHTASPYGNTSNIWISSSVPIGSSWMMQQQSIGAVWSGMTATPSWMDDGLDLSSALTNSESFLIYGCGELAGTSEDMSEIAATKQLQREWRIESSSVDPVVLNFTPIQWYAIADVRINATSLGPVTGCTWQEIRADGIISVDFSHSYISAAEIEPVPEYWMAAFDLTTAMQNAVELDQDNDGMKTWEEYVAGTEPTNAASVFIVSEIAPAFGTNFTDHTHYLTTNYNEYLAFIPPDETTHMHYTTNEVFNSCWTQRVYDVIGSTFSWPSVEGRIYDVNYSTNLSEGIWSTLEGATDLPATPPMNVVTDTPPRAAKFYKVNVRIGE